MNDVHCIVILGPTAVGKSSFIYNTYEQASLRVISADSMQVYENFNIATATPSTDNLEKFDHACISEVKPSDGFSVSEFLQRADSALIKAEGHSQTPVIVGGTPLYLKSFLYGLDDMPAKNPEFRDRMRQEHERHEPPYLHNRLKNIDPEAAENIHPNDTRRIIRALEIHHETGNTKTELTSGQNKIRNEISPFIIGLHRSKHELQKRITDRVRRMLNNGLINEIQHLRAEWNPHKTITQAIGYAEVLKFLEGKISRNELVEKMVDRTTELARKQISWFKKFPVDGWYHPEKNREELMETFEHQCKRAV